LKNAFGLESFMLALTAVENFLTYSVESDTFASDQSTYAIALTACETTSKESLHVFYRIKIGDQSGSAAKKK